MNKFFKLFIVPVLFLSSQNVFANNVDIDNQISKIRYRVTEIEQKSTDKVGDFNKLISETDKLVNRYPERPEPYVWKAIALSAQAKHKGISALSNVKQAKKLLEKSLFIDSAASDGAGYNALAMLYYKVPAWPIAFGDNDKAESYFQKALATSSNLDTNYRYGEFLVEEMDNSTKGLIYLNKALAFPDRQGRKEDALKKQEVKELINKVNQNKKEDK